MEFKLFKEFLGMDKDDKKSKGDKNFGCLYVRLNVSSWDLILSQIEPEDLADFGLEEDAHITILFGFELETTTYDAIKEALDKLNLSPIKDIKIQGVDLFENPEYDVVKFTIESSTLRELNQYFKDNFDYTTDFPNYNPHMTIAYVKSGLGEKYLDLDYSYLEPEELVSDTIVYSENPDALETDKHIYNLEDRN